MAIGVWEMVTMALMPVVALMAMLAPDLMITASPLAIRPVGEYKKIAWWVTPAWLVCCDLALAGLVGPSLPLILAVQVVPAWIAWRVL